MIVKINTDKTLVGHEKRQDYFTSQMEEKLKNYQSYITRIEAHLKDETGEKEGVNDISCLLEARLEGRQPVVVSTKGETLELALLAAIDKMKNSLGKIIGKLQSH